MMVDYREREERLREKKVFVCMFPHYITAGGPRTERRTMKRNFNNLLRTFFS
jgi:hypothetical protein